MDDLKEGLRVYYSIYLEDGAFDGPKSDQVVKRIETVTMVDDWAVITLENEPYQLSLTISPNRKIWKGEAIYTKTRPDFDDKKSITIEKAFVTNDYMSYARETVLYYKRTLGNTEMYEKHWVTNELVLSWNYSYTLSQLKKFLKRLKGTGYEELYPEDYI